MRIIGKKEKINSEETKKFFDHRAEKYDPKAPNSVTMFHDKDPEVVNIRSRKEIEKIYPMLQLNRSSKVLDLACGTGRWANIIQNDIKEYCGIDFSENLISIAKANEKRNQFSFITGDLIHLYDVLSEHHKGSFNRILLFGALMYINDDDFYDVAEQIEKCCDKHAIICIRVTSALTERLTLKNFFSEELHSEYNAIYRTDAEIRQILNQTLCIKGFEIKDSGLMYDDESMNEFQETKQFYYLIKR